MSIIENQDALLDHIKETRQTTNVDLNALVASVKAETIERCARAVDTAAGVYTDGEPNLAYTIRKAAERVRALAAREGEKG